MTNWMIGHMMLQSSSKHEKHKQLAEHVWYK